MRLILRFFLLSFVVNCVLLPTFGFAADTVTGKGTVELSNKSGTRTTYPQWSLDMHIWVCGKNLVTQACVIPCLELTPETTKSEGQVIVLESAILNFDRYRIYEISNGSSIEVTVEQNSNQNGSNWLASISSTATGSNTMAFLSEILGNNIPSGSNGIEPSWEKRFNDALFISDPLGCSAYWKFDSNGNMISMLHDRPCSAYAPTDPILITRCAGINCESICATPMPGATLTPPVPGISAYPSFSPPSPEQTSTPEQTPAPEHSPTPKPTPTPEREKTLKVTAYWGETCCSSLASGAVALSISVNPTPGEGPVTCDILSNNDECSFYHPVGTIVTLSASRGSGVVIADISGCNDIEVKVGGPINCTISTGSSDSVPQVSYILTCNDCLDCEDCLK